MNISFFPDTRAITVLQSGGIDSAVLLYAAAREVKDISILHFDYGKVCGEQERGFVKKSMRHFKCVAEFVDMKGIRAMQVGYLHQWQLDFDAEDVKEVEIVPFRDITGFYSLLANAMYHSQITNGNDLATGLIKHQQNKRPEIRKGIDLLEESVAHFNPNATHVKVRTPFLNLEKSDLIKLGSELGVPFEQTWSCTSVSSSLMHCGKCHQCKSRKKAFKAAGVQDPTQYKV